MKKLLINAIAITCLVTLSTGFAKISVGKRALAAEGLNPHNPISMALFHAKDDAGTHGFLLLREVDHHGKAGFQYIVERHLNEKIPSSLIYARAGKHMTQAPKNAKTIDAIKCTLSKLPSDELTKAIKDAKKANKDIPIDSDCL